MIKIAVIGGGASGIMAALQASNKNTKVTLFERKDRIGKKILATGNGRCNFTNQNMSADMYYCKDSDFVSDSLSKFGNEDLINYFSSLGLLIKEKNGYIYPLSENASSVVDVLRFAISESNIDVFTDSLITFISHEGNLYKLKLEDGRCFSFDKIIVSAGGKSGLPSKEVHNGYDLLKSLGIKSTKVFPALTQIKAEGLNFKSIAGVRSDCTLSLYCDDNLYMEQSGEVLFTDYGISGIVSFQISHAVGMLLDERKKPYVLIDLLPGLSEKDLENFISAKILLHDSLTIEEFLAGFHNKKLNLEFLKENCIKSASLIKDLDKNLILDFCLSYKKIKLYPTGLKGFESSQVTAGGIPTSEITNNFESKKHHGLYITGELLDVDGICGGYNLQWAFTSGYIAGKNAGEI